MNTPQPVIEKARVNSVDVLRGVAVLGILSINIIGLGLPDPAYFDPSGYGGDTGWNLKVFIINSLFFEGAMRGIFSLLFGAGLILFIQKKEEAGGGLEIATLWYRRVILLILMGMFHAYVMIWPGDILFSYGIIGLLLFPFRNSSPRNLIFFTAIILIAGAVVSHGTSVKARRQQKNYFEASEMFRKGEKVPYEIQMDYYAWIEKYAIMKPGAESLGNRISNMQKGYFAAAVEMSGDSYFFESEYHYRHNYFDILSMMLLGMGFLKLRILHAEKSFRFYGMMVLLGYGTGLLVNWWEASTYIDSDFSLITYYELLRTYDLGRIPMMLGHIGLVMLICKAGILSFFRKLLADTGRMALSNYLIQTLIANIIFIGFAQYAKWQRYELYFLVIPIWIFQMFFSWFWLRYFNYGPFEWLWRSITYQRFQKFKR